MTDIAFNKYRAAIQILMKGRDTLVEALAEDVLSQEEDLLDGGFMFNEFLESQGTRLHFLSLLVAQLEQSADTFDELALEAPPLILAEKPAPKKRKPRTKKVPQQASAETNPDDL